MTDKRTDISIVILTYQGQNELPGCLERIYRQRTKYSFEVVCVDSGSSDQTVDICRGYPLRLLRIDKSEFNHGLTRNLGAGSSSGEYIVFLTQDSLPSDELWLENLLDGFSGDENTAGVYCRQIPRADADVLTRRQLNGWLTAAPLPAVSFISDMNYYMSLEPMRKYKLCNFDNVCSCVRKSVWSRFPFPKTYFAEDLEWAKTVLEAGYKIRYQPRAAVIHSHSRPVIYEYRRTYCCHRRLYNLFGLQTVPSLRHTVLFSFSRVCSDTKYILENEAFGFKIFIFMIKNIFLSFASVFAQYKGARDEKNGVYLKAVKGV